MIPKKYKQKIAREGKQMWLDRESNVLNFINFLRSAFSSLNGLKVLDAGCAQGRDSVEMANHSLVVVGLDYNPKFIREAKKDIQKCILMKGK